MAEQCVEMSDVVIVLHEDQNHRLSDLVDRLKAAGADIADVDPENGVLEATMETTKARSIQSLDFVKHVRIIFNWMAETPKPNAANKNGDATDDETEDE
jgi:hypothetical protein